MGREWKPGDADERAATERLRDLTRRLGFGDNITEPQADNDTIVAWFEEQGRDASEWREHELWRGDCYAAGHPDDEDCAEHGPTCCCNRAHVSGAGETGLRALDEVERRLRQKPLDPEIEIVDPHLWAVSIVREVRATTAGQAGGETDG